MPNFVRVPDVEIFNTPWYSEDEINFTECNVHLNSQNVIAVEYEDQTGHAPNGFFVVRVVMVGTKNIEILFDDEKSGQSFLRRLGVVEL